MKDWKKALGLALVLTAISTTLSVAITLIIKAKKARSLKFKELLRELYPQHEWEHTGLYIHLWDVKYMAWYPEEFDYREGETEAEVIDAINVRVPGLRAKVEFSPIAEFEEMIKGKCGCK